MHIVITSTSFCEYLIQQANGLAALGHSVLLVIPAPLPKDTVGVDFARFLAPTIQYFTYNVTGKWRLGFYLELFHAVSVFSPDVLHIHENGEIETFALISRFHRIPLVVTIHDVTTHPGADFQIKLRRRLIKKLLRRRTDLIHLHGEKLREKLKESHPKLACKSAVIPHGALSLFKQWENEPVEREPLTCLFFGRMEKYRGLDNLLKIGTMLKESLPGIRIVAAGRGSELEKYKAKMAALGIFEIHDTFIPNKDVHRFFGRASLLLLPYHEASQSGVVSMALPFGLPVVATDVGSIPETITDGQHGRIVPVGDLDGFAGAVRKLLSDEDLRRQMGTACLQLGESLSFARLAGEFDSLYTHAIEMRRRT